MALQLVILVTVNNGLYSKKQLKNSFFPDICLMSKFSNSQNWEIKLFLSSKWWTLYLIHMKILHCHLLADSGSFKCHKYILQFQKYQRNITDFNNKYPSWDIKLKLNVNKKLSHFYLTLSSCKRRPDVCIDKQDVFR